MSTFVATIEPLYTISVAKPELARLEISHELKFFVPPLDQSSARGQHRQILAEPPLNNLYGLYLPLF